jgi:hypothetical protein
MRRIAVVRTMTVLVLLVSVAAPAWPASAEPGLTSVLTAVRGQGIGHLSLSPTARHPDFWAQGEVSIHGGLPSTTYIFQRAVDHTPGDGVCDIAPAPPDGWITLVTLATSPAGAGAAHFVRHTPGVVTPAGTRFDVIGRLMTSDGTQLLQSRCMTVQAKVVAATPTFLLTDVWGPLRLPSAKRPSLPCSTPSRPLVRRTGGSTNSRGRRSSAPRGRDA